ncbi:MAG: ribosome small subunit-dependent GTPase A [Oscillospiraceae bacterium]|jgi:ribosome biogenesis GTPase|nr:ribosome small subunit-dependent GTPase A [Oscillospiraceae bacterium]
MADKGAVSGRILRGVGGFYYVAAGGETIEAKPRGIFRKTGFKPLAGDFCRLSINEDGKGIIESVGERRNFFLRPPVANLDRICFVVSTCEPAPNFQALDGLIAVAERKKTEPFIIITKTDLKPGGEILELYKNAGFETYAADYRNPESIAAIKSALSGKVSAFCGNSGAGKSTLLNALDASLGLATAGISRKLGRGKHTTREARLYPFEGGYIADTPGFSRIEPGQDELILKDELQYCFREFAPYIGKCRFSGCLHKAGKGCAVLGALEAGEISSSRYKSYFAMLCESERIKAWERR